MDRDELISEVWPHVPVFVASYIPGLIGASGKSLLLEEYVYHKAVRRMIDILDRWYRKGKHYIQTDPEEMRDNEQGNESDLTASPTMCEALRKLRNRLRPDTKRMLDELLLTDCLFLTDAEQRKLNQIRKECGMEPVEDTREVIFDLWKNGHSDREIADHLSAKPTRISGAVNAVKKKRPKEKRVQR